MALERAKNSLINQSATLLLLTFLVCSACTEITKAAAHARLKLLTGKESELTAAIEEFARAEHLVVQGHLAGSVPTDRGTNIAQPMSLFLYQNNENVLAVLGTMNSNEYDLFGYDVDKNFRSIWAKLMAHLNSSFGNAIKLEILK